MSTSIIPSVAPGIKRRYQQALRRAIKADETFRAARDEVIRLRRMVAREERRECRAAVRRYKQALRARDVAAIERAVKEVNRAYRKMRKALALTP